MLRAFALFLTAALAVGCGSESDSAPHDASARGTQEIPRSADWEEVHYESVLQIGAVEGDVTFGQITSLLQAPDSTIWLTDQHDASVQHFSPEGARLARFGGKGEGPGEFVAPALMGFLSEPSTLTWDRALRRFTILLADGSPVVIVPQTSMQDEDEPPSQPQPMYVTPEGNVAFLGMGGFFAYDLRPNTILQNPYTVILGSVEGPGGTFAEVVGKRYLWDGKEPLLLPFSPRPSFATAGETVAVIDGGDAALIVGSIDTEPERLEFPELAPTEVSLNPRQAYTDFWSQSERRSAAARLSLLDRSDTPDHVPAFDQIIGGSDGSFWLRRFQIDGFAAQVWEVLDPNGSWIKTAHIPARTRLHSVFPHVLGIAFDEFNVQTVHVFAPTRLER